MRITEHALRKIIREELTMSRLFEAETADQKSDRLGDNTKRRRELEDAIKSAIIKVLESDNNLKAGVTFEVFYNLKRGVAFESAENNIVIPLNKDRTDQLYLNLDFRGPINLSDPTKTVISGQVASKFAGAYPSDNLIRLTSVPSGQITVDIPAAAQKEEPTPAVLPNAELEYKVKNDDILAAIVTKFYGLPYNSKLFPLYRLLSNYYMTPKRPNPNSIKPGDVLRLPAELKFNDGKKVPRKTGVG